MKYDLTKKPTRGAQRTLQAFSDTMYQLIGKKDFEDISVNEICQISNFPRATFYNYFDDKYDLLNYCWYLIVNGLRGEKHRAIRATSDLKLYLDRLYELFDSHRELLQHIVLHNPVDSALFTNFNAYLRKTLREIFTNDLTHYDDRIPLSMLVTHFSNTVMMMLVAMFLQEDPISLNQAHEYLGILLGYVGKA